MTPSVFARIEEKYLIGSNKANTLLDALEGSLTEDAWGESYIRNLYLDTPERLLIRRSIEKPCYKEKLRVRAYGCEEASDSSAFLELKKKLNGKVYKRRAAMSLDEARGFVEWQSSGDEYSCRASNALAQAENNALEQALSSEDLLQRQIRRELAYAIEHYAHLQPFMNIHYSRCAYKYTPEGNSTDVRITIDCNAAWAPGSWDGFYWGADDPRLEPLLPADVCIMEIKALGGLPIELVRILSSIGIYPTSFSKVGCAYMASQQRSEKRVA